MQSRIQLPKPCNESWDNMQPQGNGRHCDQCCKTVVDFTHWNNEAILIYLTEHQDQQVCGRFRKDQLAATQQEEFVFSVATSRLPYCNQLAAILLVVFGIVHVSCNNETAIPPAKSRITFADTSNKTSTESRMLGEPVLPASDSPAKNLHKQTAKKHSKKIDDEKPNIVMPEEYNHNDVMGVSIIIPEPYDTARKIKTK